MVGEEVLSKDEAAVVTEALRAVVERGTASYYHDLDAEIDRPAAGKTGTSNEFIDAWFIGFIPQLSTSVWVGYPNERRSMVNINGLEQINGENYPLDIWSLYMQSAVQKYPTVQQFDTPSPDLHLEVKTDGRTYVKPEPPPRPPAEEPQEEKSKDRAQEEQGSGNADDKLEKQGPQEPRQTPPARDSDQERAPSSASPPSASPEPDGG
jgi:penicillin-binding protein 1A